MHTRAPTSGLARPGYTIAGRYRLEGLLGQGGMGSVWAATHLGLGSEVAIKLVSRELVASAEALRRFDTEAKAVAKIQSRHVVQVYDNGALEDGTPYLVMELLRGESLHARIHRAGPVPIAEAVEILAQCCKALGRAHAAGIVHRDVKPDNIFLASSSEDGAVVKVLDFGIAKLSQADESTHSSTRTGTVLGTPLYMSPEQARGLRSVDHRTDIYSLGLVSYTMLTGNLAFSSESFGDLLLKICTQPLPSLCAAAPWLPKGMEAWFQYACARDADQRCGSTDELLARLRVAAGVSVPSAVVAEPDPDPGARVRDGGTYLAMQGTGQRHARRGTALAFGGVAVGAALVAIVVVAAASARVGRAGALAMEADAPPVAPASALPAIVAPEDRPQDARATEVDAAASAPLRVVPVRAPSPALSTTASSAPAPASPPRARAAPTDDINLGY